VLPVSPFAADRTSLAGVFAGSDWRVRAAGACRETLVSLRKKAAAEGGQEMAPRGLKDQVKHRQSQARGMKFRLIYYASMFLIAGVLVGILCLGSLFE
jgi:hypothetical protein